MESNDPDVQPNADPIQGVSPRQPDRGGQGVEPAFAENPYATVSTGTAPPEDVGDVVVTAQLASPAAPRCWTPLAVAGISLASFLLLSSLVFALALWVVTGEISIGLLRDEDRMQQAFQTIMQSRLGFLLVVVLPQLGLVCPCLIAARLSPQPDRQRLGLERGHWPLWAWFAAAAATPLVGMISGALTGVFLEESSQLKQTSEIFRAHGETGFLIPLAFFIGATPAICEELLFRGYMQTRLVRGLGALPGVLIASFFFALFHMDFVHIIAVFPLGLFLGWVSWRSGSLFPAMLAHFVNNVISVIAVVMAPDGQTDVLSLPTNAVLFLVLGAGIVGMTAVIIAAILYGRPTPVATSVSQTPIG